MTRSVFVSREDAVASQVACEDPSHACTSNMNILTNLNRELFQRLLADAFVVQESGMDTHSLGTVVQVQRLIDTAPLDADRVMNIIAEGTRNIGHANGIAIARLEANQLTYRAGAGSATTYPGRRVPAVFTASAQPGPRHEILRVENAETDKRIEAAICKQFEARSLLILPVYHGLELTGLLQVLFTQEHSFQDREVYAYRLMAGLVGEVMARESLDSQREAMRQAGLHSPAYGSTYKNPIIPVPLDYAQKPATKMWNDTVCKVVRPAAIQLEHSHPIVKAVTRGSQPLHQIQHKTIRWRMAVAAIVIAFVAARIVHEYRVRERVLLQTNTTRESPVTSYQPASEHNPSQRQSELHAARRPKSQYERTPALRGSTNYIATDVITRHFANPTLSLQVRPTKEVNIGEDVTVRCFTYIPALAKPRISGALQ